MKQKLKLLALGVISVMALASCGDSPKVGTNTKTDSISAKVENWNYADTLDKMDNLKNYFAKTESENTVEFGAPYEGGSTFALMIQKLKNSPTTLYLEVSKGQFLVGIGDETTARVKFDNEPPFEINISGTSDLRSNVVFLLSEKKLLDKIKKSKKMTIETEFFQEGKRQADFNVEGLVWNH